MPVVSEQSYSFVVRLPITFGSKTHYRNTSSSLSVRCAATYRPLDTWSAIAPQTATELVFERGGERHLVKLHLGGDSGLARVELRAKKCFPSLEKLFDRVAEIRKYTVTASELAQAARDIHINPPAPMRAEEPKESPQYILGNAYIRYIHVRRCYQARLGYGAIYISDTELEAARKAVRQLEQKYRNDIGVDAKTGAPWTTDSMWSRANEIANSDSWPENRELCQRALDDLLASYRKRVPERAIMPKDF